ncbi:MAG: hypothetical protein J3K34DRAFT_173585 [Monoraphidium minutum]|nr:MAG: hypothetical protein J3K34DRAFT_173585 [Monoraphidium minutum]
MAEVPSSYYTAKTRPTDFHLFANVTSITLVPSESVGRLRVPYRDDPVPTAAPVLNTDGAEIRPPPPLHHLSVPAALAPPAARAAAAAARAALAGVTRLEVAPGWRPWGTPRREYSTGILDPSRLAAAVLYLPGLRAITLRCTCDVATFEYEGAAVAAALSGCPNLESLHWEMERECFISGDSCIYAPCFPALAAYLPHLTELRAHISAEGQAELHGLTSLRRLELFLDQNDGDEAGNYGEMMGLSALTNLESLELRRQGHFYSFFTSDLQPLSALTRLKRAPLDLPSCHAASRLVRLELGDLGRHVIDRPRRTAQLLAALARGAPRLERLRVSRRDSVAGACLGRRLLRRHRG